MDLVPISELTEHQLSQLFSESDREAARGILYNEVMLDFDSRLENPEQQKQGIERIRSAVLKLSQGKLDRLPIMTQKAKADWRDVLLWAGFADDSTAHKRWVPGSKDPFLSPWLDVFFTFVKAIFGRT